jgi:hypothetical protein
LKEYSIPLPPLTTQQAIVAEIEAEQTLVAANRELIARFEKKIAATLAGATIPPRRRRPEPASAFGTFPRKRGKETAWQHLAARRAGVWHIHLF